ncbi:MAG: hypothetical protein KME29_10790 [Calothrix sp. FI2-JRJ7]|jgi:hypothetical protein|nr:hypothetical protein [Calothrix sp. FI2-JRJ7]
MKLLGHEKKELRIALADAYPSKAKLNMLVTESDLSNNIDEIAFGEDFNDIIFKLISWAESNDKVNILIQAAYDENPNNAKLKEFVQNRQTIFDFAKVSNNTNSFPEHDWKEICFILTKIDIEFITDACRCTLENISKNQDVLGAYPELNKLDIPKLKTILLQKCPDNDKQAPTIIEFAERLAKEVEQPYQNDLNKWVQTVATKLNIKLPTYSQSRKIFGFLKPTLEPYLMIVVTPIDTNKVLLKAELILDYKSKDSNAKAAIKIELAETKTDISCLITQIADNIYNFIRESRKKLQGKKYNLTIEVFLPIQYLNNSIEFDQITFNDSEVKPIGYEHHFLVRSLERFSTNDEVYLNNLYKRWDVLEEILENSPNEQDLQKKFEFLSEVNNCNWDELENSWLFEERFAIKVKCLPNSDVEQRKFFQAILRAGVPISLWARCDNLLDIDKFDSLLTVKHLRNFNHFFEAVWKLRRLAYAKQDKTSYLGYHLGFLCDNPYRIPFCLMPQNQDFIETGY